MRLYVYKNGASDSASSSLTINAAPHPVITAFGDLLSVPGVYSSYQWYNGVVAIPGATNAFYTATEKGAYSVVVDSAGCKGTGSFNTLSAIMLTGSPQTFRVAQAGNTIELIAAAPLPDALAVTIYNATGRRVHNDIWPAGSSTKQIGADAFAPGIYIVRLGNAATSVVLRFVKG